MQDINQVTIIGRLTRDPEMRSAGSSEVCGMRIASSGSRKNAEGDWEDVPNYFDVSVFGKTAENCGKYLSKGSRVCIAGKLRWREWKDKDGNNRQSVDIQAHSVQFLNTKKDDERSSSPSDSGLGSDIPVDTADFVSAGVGAADDDIPFMRDEFPMEWEVGYHENR
jgi:single-strand DNA-binding protein